MANDKPEMKDTIFHPELSLNEELPRLAEQSRMLFQAQNMVIPKLSLPEGPGRFLDLRSGPGVNLSLVKDLFPKYEYYGLESSKELHYYAKLNYKDINWVQGSIYDLPFENKSIDIAHAGFLFIHLDNPLLALEQVHRILKDGGKVLILDVDDSTFKGFASMENLIKKYHEVDSGDRTIMSKLKNMAEKKKFNLIAEDTIIVDNTGRDNSPEFKYPNMRLGKMTFWAMFAFMGQIKSLISHYENARKEYMSLNDNFCEISLIFQVYQKQ